MSKQNKHIATDNRMVATGGQGGQGQGEEGERSQMYGVGGRLDFGW